MVTKSTSNASAKQKQTVIVHVGDTTSKRKKPRRKRSSKPKGQPKGEPSFGQVIRVPPTVVMQTPPAPPVPPMAPAIMQPVQQVTPITAPVQKPVPVFERPRTEHKPLEEQTAKQESQTQYPITIRVPKKKIPVPSSEIPESFAKSALHNVEEMSFGQAASLHNEPPESFGKKIAVRELKKRFFSGIELTPEQQKQIVEQETINAKAREERKLLKKAKQHLPQLFP